MPVPLTLSQAQTVSSEANPKYLWSAFLGEEEDPVTGMWIDPLTVDIELLRDTRKDMTPIQMTENTPLTTISYNLYGHTSMWAVILYLNGYQHPDEVPAGATILVPSQASVDAILNKSQQTTSNVGKTFKV